MSDDGLRIGWIGAGRMGRPMAARLVRAGRDVTVYNRTAAKTESLTALGASLAGRPMDLADRDIVFTMVADPAALLAVTAGESGLFADPLRAPRLLVDCSTVSEAASAEVASLARERGAGFLAAPVSGNPKVVRAGRLAIVVSGERADYDAALPILRQLGWSVSYVGEGEKARTVKICVNLLLALVSQGMGEVTVLAQRAGVPRAAFLDFLNGSVVGSTFTRYKTPQLVGLDFTPTFTAHLHRKDVELGLALGGSLSTPTPLVAQAHQTLLAAIAEGLGDLDFASVLRLQARAAGLELEPEVAGAGDGLEPLDDIARAELADS